MIFCPYDGNMLVIEKEHDPKRPDAPDRNCFGCHTCPYIFPVEKQYAEREKLERKQVDDVIGGKEAWKNAPRAQATCPKCEHDTAFHRELQTRSADEPMTNFYKCCECGHDWRD